MMKAVFDLGKYNTEDFAFCLVNAGNVYDALITYSARIAQAAAKCRLHAGKIKGRHDIYMPGDRSFIVLHGPEEWVKEQIDAKILRKFP